MSKIAVNEITDEVGTGAPAFPNGMSVTGAALTDPEITGGIYLGGTGTANKLDDYEEGTWTASFHESTNKGGTLQGTNTAFYTKVGGLITVSYKAGGLPTPIRSVSGLPFVQQNDHTTFTTADSVFGYAGAGDVLNYRSSDGQNTRAVVTYRID